MPLVAHNNLPTFQRLRARGQEVLSVRRAEQQDIRELKQEVLTLSNKVLENKNNTELTAVDPYEV